MVLALNDEPESLLVLPPLTEDITEGVLLEPADAVRALVVRLVVEEEATRLLPGLPLLLAGLWSSVLLTGPLLRKISRERPSGGIATRERRL
jgi:hypothetical protein